MVRPDIERPVRLRNDTIRWPTRIGMKLPNRERAILPREKISDYLLSTTHPDGRHKRLSSCALASIVIHGKLLARLCASMPRFTTWLRPKRQVSA